MDGLFGLCLDLVWWPVARLAIACGFWDPDPEQRSGSCVLCLPCPTFGFGIGIGIDVVDIPQ